MSVDLPLLLERVGRLRRVDCPLGPEHPAEHFAARSGAGRHLAERGRPRRRILAPMCRLPSGLLFAALAACGASNAAPAPEPHSEADTARAPIASASVRPPEPTAATLSLVPLEPVPGAACTMEVIEPDGHRGLHTYLGIGMGFAPVMGESVLPFTVTWAARFRAAFVEGKPLAEIELLNDSIQLRAQARFQSLRVVPDKPIELTPWLRVYRAYAKTVKGDVMTLDYELPEGLSLTATVPALERRCGELDPRIDKMMENIRWCHGPFRHHQLSAGPALPLLDPETRKPIGELVRSKPLTVALLEKDATHVKIGIPARKLDTMVTAWVDAGRVSKDPRSDCGKWPPDAPASDFYFCKRGTPLTFVPPGGGDARVIGATTGSSFSEIWGSVCGRENGPNLDLLACYSSGETPAVGTMQVREFAKSCRRLFRAPATP